MKVLQCEMCGSQDLVKDGGVFVCQACGAKYTEDVKGSVKVDTSDELKNLYEIARRAKDSDNCENGAKYYDMILTKDPNSWEANFYSAYFKALSCTIEQSDAIESLMNSLPSIFELIKENTSDDEQKNVFKEIQQKSSALIHSLSRTAQLKMLSYNTSIRQNYLPDFSRLLVRLQFLSLDIADILDDDYNGKFQELSVEGWKDAISIKLIFPKYMNTQDNELRKKIIKDYQEKIDDIAAKILKYDSNYVTPQVIVGFSQTNDSTKSTADSTSNGCYVATAVYGSYDCPEVWTLRRFRDFTLDETWYGRLFIKIYYATSPTFVKHFGNVRFFKLHGKRWLDKWVTKLNQMGVENTPYKDKY